MLLHTDLLTNVTARVEDRDLAQKIFLNNEIAQQLGDTLHSGDHVKMTLSDNLGQNRVVDSLMHVLRSTTIGLKRINSAVSDQHWSARVVKHIEIGTKVPRPHVTDQIADNGSGTSLVLSDLKLGLSHLKRAVLRKKFLQFRPLLLTFMKDRSTLHNRENRQTGG